MGLALIGAILSPPLTQELDAATTFNGQAYGKYPSMCALKETLTFSHHWAEASQVALVVKILPGNAGDIREVGSIPGSGKSPGGRNDNPLQYSLDRGAWRPTVHRVT